MEHIRPFPRFSYNHAMLFISCICLMSYCMCVLSELLPEIKWIACGFEAYVARRNEKGDRDSSTLIVCPSVPLYICTCTEWTFLTYFSFHPVWHCWKDDTLFELCSHHPPLSGIDTSHPPLPLTVCLCSHYVCLLHKIKPHLYVSQLIPTPRLPL